MKLAAAAFCCLGMSVPAYAQTVQGTCEQPFEAAFPPGGEIKMKIRSGDIDVVGGDSPSIRVTCESRRHPDKSGQIKISLRIQERAGELRVSGGPEGDFRMLIEVPRSSHLWVRSPAGDLSVRDVVGNKDISIHAGDLVIGVGSPADYSHAEGSVKVGDLTASAFGVTKDGFFRSFKADNPEGKYRLHAHVGAGDLVLK